ncbi:hypothetical protein [Mobilicoccus pelagius]|uniref:Uncharacterized protein n=1 Tax=Mobilicoccus pelagius NBRC 104925 TaxID=1089455 RepID=H5UNM6_9MICO|nr:hypothetical protein [Mobilicoccus pelagius]GAB47334.1 hypothetical protein MOPEL_009_00240 [Mobilicoccus pelagius NBRC 104925]
MTPPHASSDPASATSADARRARSAARLLGGGGRATLTPYRHDPTAELDVLSHGLTADGRLVVVCTETSLADVAAGELGVGAGGGLRNDVADDVHDVRLDVHREAASAEVRILVSSLHLLARVEWVSIAEQRRLAATAELPVFVREPAWSNRNRVGILSVERVALHDSEGTAAWPFAEVAAVAAELSPRATTEALDAAEAVLAADQPALVRLCRDVGAGRADGRVLARRPVGVALTAGRGVHCLDTDPSGITLLHVDDDAETIVFAGFPSTGPTSGPTANPAHHRDAGSTRRL